MLQVLPSHISNLIAAGEVVQRPSSVVKELVENSIDAGAINISVNIEDAGRTLIQVFDDGCGMSDEEAKLCFARHATSKISVAEDLHSILTYGFRGEALASIAAISEVTLRTKKSDSEVGTEVHFSESTFVSQEPVSTQNGTCISVRNIFYNVPARRKFLKSDNAEFRNIDSEFCRVALCHPEVALRLIHNKKEVYVLRPVQNIKQRILEICGREMIKELVDVKTDTSIVCISGFVGKPEDAKKSSGNQYFFVNGRYFRSPYLHKAVLKAYNKLIPDGYLPAYFIFFEIDPGNIDINIHPAKTEIKFENESSVFEILNAAVREALGMNSLGPSIDFDMEGVPDIPPARKGLFVPPPKINYDPLFNPFDTAEADHSDNSYSNKNNFIVQGYGEVFEEQIPNGKNTLQIQGKYLLTPVKSGLLLINIRRAKERIFYERYLKSLDDGSPVAQETLFPLTIELNSASYSILMEKPERLHLLGFDITPFGPLTIAVNGLPDGYSTDLDSARRSIDDLINTLSEGSSDDFFRADERSRIAISMAKSAAGGFSKGMSSIEAQLLVDSLFACTQPDRTPDGKMCMTIITLEELDKKM